MCRAGVFLFSVEYEHMITIYTTNSCAYCAMVKKYLTLKGQKFETVNIDDIPERRAEAIIVAGGRLTVPVTTDGTSTVVGWKPAELSKLVR